MQQYGLLCLLLLFITGSYGQDPTTTPVVDWNGDPNICTAEDPTVTDPPGRQLPVFTNQAEFTLERVEIKHVLNTTLPSELTMYQYLYDYDANKLILIKNSNGFIDVEYYYYEARKKSTYYRRDFCVVSDIPTDIDVDGSSAIILHNASHIRPLNEFLLFSNFDPRKPIVRPKYIGQAIVRGIPVDQWETCIVDKTQYRTMRRTWSFAQKGVSMPTGVVDKFAVPIQALISSSVVFPNNTQAVEFDEIFNVHSFRPGIIESTDQLAPPKGVFCDAGEGQNLISLEDINIEWPDRFSVRVEASTSAAGQWQRFHLRYDRGRQRGGRRLRYDYLPVGADDYQSVIHDFADNLTYTIDRRLGSCKIQRGVERIEVDPAVDPIGFFIRHEARFIFRPREKAWEFNGFRSCRGNSIKCSVVTSSVDKFPVIVEPDTGKPSGETWEATNVEYGWSTRAPFAPTGRPLQFDYPVHLYLKLYRFRDPANPSPFNLRTEDIEYEFYEMSHEWNPYDFDTSVCYRSLNLEYLHLGFVLKLSRGNVIDGNHLDRRFLELRLHDVLRRDMRINSARISDLEIDHERNTNDVTILFTLLGPTPAPESPTGVELNEISAEAARERLERAINNGNLQFEMQLTDERNTTVQFTAEKGSLKASKQFMSSHMTGRQVINESYSKSAQTGAILGGLIVGVIVGVLVAALVRIVRKDPMPAMPGMPTSFSNTLPSISYYNKKPTSDPTPTTTQSDA